MCYDCGISLAKDVGRESELCRQQSVQHFKGRYLQSTQILPRLELEIHTKLEKFHQHFEESNWLQTFSFKFLPSLSSLLCGTKFTLRVFIVI